MRRLILPFILYIVCSTIAHTQPCLPNGITFTTQGQIDSFQINYPGCSTIEGDVYIRGSNFTNLIGLSAVKFIHGDLKIGNWQGSKSVRYLTNLSGLDSLIFVGGFVWIYGTNLNSLSGLENLDYIGKGLVIRYNHLLTDLTGLEGLETIGGNLQIKIMILSITLRHWTIPLLNSISL